MIEEIKNHPKGWLSLRDCKGIFHRFREDVTFDQPIPPFETREPGKLEGILGSVSQTFDGKYLNSTVLDATSAYFNQLIKGHAFLNGNKRLAVLYTHFFLLMNNLDFKFSFHELWFIALQVAILAERGWSSKKTLKIIKKMFGDNIVKRKPSKLSAT